MPSECPGLRRFDTATIVVPHPRRRDVALWDWLGFPPRFPGRTKICPALSIQAQRGVAATAAFRPVLIRTGLLFCRAPVAPLHQNKKAPAAGLRGLISAELYISQSSGASTLPTD